MELSGRLQELQHEVNCMNDSKDFQDAESVRSGNSHVTSRPVSFPPHPIPEGLLRPFLRIAAPQRRAAMHLGYTWYIGKRFCKSTCIFISSLSSRIESMGGNWGAASYVCSGEEWKTRTKSRSEMPVWTVSQRFCHLQWRKLFKQLWRRPTTTADFRSSFLCPHTSNVCLLEDKVQDRGMYLFTISYGSDAMDQGSGVGWFSGWIKIFVICSWYFNAEFWSTWCEDCFGTEQNPPEFPVQKENQSGGTKGPERGPFPSSRQIAYLIYDQFRVTETHDSVENYTDLFTIFFVMTIFRNSILSGTEYYCLWRKSRMMTYWKNCTN